MPKQILKYQLHELCNKNPQIIIETEPGVQISIELTSKGTMVSMPFGNEIEAKEFGHLLVKPTETKP